MTPDRSKRSSDAAFFWSCLYTAVVAASYCSCLVGKSWFPLFLILMFAPEDYQFWQLCKIWREPLASASSIDLSTASDQDSYHLPHGLKYYPFDHDCYQLSLEVPCSCSYWTFSFAYAEQHFSQSSPCSWDKYYPSLIAGGGARC